MSASNRCRKERQESRKAELRAQVAYYLTKSGYSKSEFATLLGMSAASFYNKLNNPDNFKLNEFNLLLEYLNLDANTKLKLIA